MVEAKAHGKVLVLDDHYGIASEDFYSRTDFERDYGSLPFTFTFASAWDEKSGRYTAAEALRAVEVHKADGVLLDIVFEQQGPGGQLGLEILRELTGRFPAVPVVVMTVLARDEAWAECARLGAVDYLPKPLDARLLSLTLDRYVGVGPEHWLIGQNRLFTEAVNLAALASEGGQTPIMLTGETGTGKGLLARFAHRHGRRSAKPFNVIDLSNLPPDHQAANLFGYRRGAFTGADRDEPGRFLAAEGGTVFLDEIGDLDEGTQLRILRVADGGEVSRLGDGKTSRVDVQIVSATNADLSQRIKNRQFRYDLWARLNGMPVTLPSLAQRRDDIPLLVRHLLRCQAILRGHSVPELPAGVEMELGRHPWEGNVRALRSYAQRVFDRAGDGKPDAAMFRAALPESGGAFSLGSFASGNRETETAATRTTLGPADPLDRLQQLRLDEFALLYEALEQTRDPISGAVNRAKAAALLKGKARCSTNEFDRWVVAIWSDLNADSRAAVAARFPEIALTIKLPAAEGNRL